MCQKLNLLNTNTFSFTILNLITVDTIVESFSNLRISIAWAELLIKVMYQIKRKEKKRNRKTKIYTVSPTVLWLPLKNHESPLCKFIDYTCCILSLFIIDRSRERMRNNVRKSIEYSYKWQSKAEGWTNYVSF